MPIPNPSTKSFTLIELIIVIIIVGILAALGISQYSKMVEKGRGSEARMTLGVIRKLGYEYYLQNGTITGLNDAAVNTGTAADQIPQTCRSTNYFYYSTGTSSGSLWSAAIRCTSGGKTPQGPSCRLDLYSNFDTGVETWVNTGGCGY